MAFDFIGFHMVFNSRAKNLHSINEKGQTVV